MTDINWEKVADKCTEKGIDNQHIGDGFGKGSPAWVLHHSTARTLMGLADAICAGLKGNDGQPYLSPFQQSIIDATREYDTWPKEKKEAAEHMLAGFMKGNDDEN